MTYSLKFGALVAAALIFPALDRAEAAGDETIFNPPKKTETTKDCFSERQWDPEQKTYVRYSDKVNGVWDPELRRCIRPDKAGYLQSNLLEGAVRELAYAGQLEAAQQVLAQMPQQDDFVLTYLGFTHRKQGRMQEANAYYAKALTQNPDNILARSYMGQGFVSDGDFVGAREQLLEIRARGGEGSWPEISLLNAIETGTGYDY